VRRVVVVGDNGVRDAAGGSLRRVAVRVQTMVVLRQLWVGSWRPDHVARPVNASVS
jgi:hypothetical protein